MHYLLYFSLINLYSCYQTTLVGQLKQPIILNPLSQIHQSQNHHNNHRKMENFLNFRNCPYRRYLTQMYLLFSEIVTARINWQQGFLLSNSVCNHTRDWQIRLPLGGRPILLITRMITDRIGFYSVKLPSFIAWVGKRVLPQYLDIEARKLRFVWITFSSLSSCNFDI